MRNLATPKPFKIWQIINALSTKHTDAATWSFSKNGKLHHQEINACIEIDNSYCLETYALEGAGIVRLPKVTTMENVIKGKLVQLLEDYTCVEPSGDISSIWIIYAGRDLPHRIRLMVDYLKKQIPLARADRYRK